MNVDDARKIISYVAKKTESRWKQYDEHWNNIDEVFIRRGYEQGGFAAWEFTEVLREHGIFSIQAIGVILDAYSGDRKYNHNFAGSLNSRFYQEMKNGLYGEKGKKFYTCIENFKGNPGAWFWNKLWQILVCCNYLKNLYKGSFSYFLKMKYIEFKKKQTVSDDDFLKMSFDEWEEFKKLKKPWNELYGIGENVFDFIIGDTVEASFAKDSYKFDSANSYFLKVTGISELIPQFEREKVVKFLKDLGLKYTLREINKGIYTYCSKTEANNFGFCRDKMKCRQCEVNDVCKKNF